MISSSLADYKVSNCRNDKASAAVEELLEFDAMFNLDTYDDTTNNIISKILNISRKRHHFSYFTDKSGVLQPYKHEYLVNCKLCEHLESPKIFT